MERQAWISRGEYERRKEEEKRRYKDLDPSYYKPNEDAIALHDCEPWRATTPPRPNVVMCDDVIALIEWIPNAGPRICDGLRHVLAYINFCPFCGVDLRTRPDDATGG